MHAYIDDVLVITKNNVQDHLKSLDRFLQRLTEVGLKVNTEKAFFGLTETEYLSLWVINDRVRPLSYKLEDIKAIDVPTNVRNIWKFLRLVNYYRYMWRKRAHTLATLTNLCSTKVQFKYTDVENNAFIAMKK